MRLSRNYIKTIRETAKEYDSPNHALLTQAGFIDQTASGVYTLLTPGWRVLRKIEQIVREEMDALGASEILMPSLQPKALWDQTRRWDKVDVLYKVTSRYGHEYGLAATAEEVITELAQRYITSYKDLPLALYQIAPKYRDEARAKSGILRGREFRMKDMYSFHTSEEDFEDFYKKAIASYLTIFSRCGLDDVKITEASGGDFSRKHSHEFNVVTPSGEVDLLYCEGSTRAFNEEVVKGDPAKLLECPEQEVIHAKAIEIGNIFDLESQYSEAFNLKYVDEYGKKHLVRMGCYGIGTSRLLGAIAEVHRDKDGLIWPDEVRPYDVHLVNIASDPAFAGLVYRTLTSEGIDVLFDDRENVSAGEKFVTADLIGIPVRLLVSDKTEQQVEWKERTEKKTSRLSVQETVKMIRDYYSQD